MDREFEYGPVSRGIYIALVSLLPVVALVRPAYLLGYILFLLFLGFGLRPFLVFSGLYGLWNNVGSGVKGKWDRKFLLRRRKEIEREERQKKLRQSRHRDPRLPKNW